MKAGFEPAVRLLARQFSKLVVSATHPLHQNPLKNVGAKLVKALIPQNKNISFLNKKRGRFFICFISSYYNEKGPTFIFNY